MSLMLEIVGPQASALGDAARKIFVDAGGSIGRASVNDWVIPDAYVSGQHARIHFLEGKYFLEDTSTNGVFIKNPGNRLPKGQRYPLQTGDRVFIDAYEIKVTIDNAESSAPDFSDGYIANGQSHHTSASRHATTEAIPVSRSHNGAEAAAGIPVELTIPLPEPSDALADAIAGKDLAVDFDPFGDVAEEEIEDPPVQEAMVPPPVVAQPPPQSPVTPRSATTPVPVSAAAYAGKDTLDLQAWLAASGIPAASITPELVENFGRILQVAIGGIMDLLREREHARQQFGLDRTTYKKADNNPLKFSVNVEDALHNLLVKRNSAYLPPVEAFEDVFRDMRDHETALLQAMRAAFNAMLHEFNPEKLQTEFNKGVQKGAIWSGPIKLRYWSLYQDHYKELTRNPDQCFRELFADEFAKEYTAQIERLKRSKY